MATPKRKRPSTPARRSKAAPRHESLPPVFAWQNFRGFVDTGRHTLKPLTVVLGANNSGKSSLLAPLLLLKQTLASTDTSTALITRAELTDVGSFGDLVHNHETSRTVTFSLFVHHHDVPTGASKLPDVVDVPPGGIEVGFASRDEGRSIVLESFHVFDVYRRPYFSRHLQPDGKYSFSGPLRDFLLRKKAKTVLTRVEEDNRPVHFLFSPQSVVPEWTGDDQKANWSASEQRAAFFYIAVLERIRSEIGALLQRTAYIGPMRERPQRFYEHTGDKPRSVGPRGQYAHELFFREKDSIGPHLQKWARALCLADKIACVPISEHVFTIELRSGRTSYNLADAGFGVSQILPILIEGYREGSRRILVKQPEIHLNPKQQCVFAEIAADLVSRNVELWVETHSEHFLLALRRLVAEHKIDTSKIGIYYVDKHEEASRVRAIPIRADGHIEDSDWPNDFLDDALKQALALANAQAGQTTAT